jgi:hydroxyethylthiazole kinase-like uncharacterized protein yjeF
MGFYKPGHFLLPGKMYVGKLKKLNIGLTSSSKKCPDINLIEKSFFKKEIPKHKININKYDKGHVIVLGGKMPGASRLVAFSSRKTGAGLSTIIVDKENLKFYLKTEPGTIIEIIKQESLKKKNVLIIGPGLGKDYSRKRVIEVINSFFGPIIVDADAISIFKDHKEVFYNLIRKKKNIILTPHINEFKRLFDYNDKSKMISCLKAAEKISNCVLLKGNDTIIAFPSGKIWINNLPNNSLATAGSGDVLCGIISGFLSQKMNYEHAIVAAVWVQSQVAKPKKNVVVEDFLKDIPLVIDSLKKK